MGGKRWDAAARALLALVQSGIYFTALYYSKPSQRRWCTHDWQKYDCLGEDGQRAMRSNGTDLQVVLPSYGQTGTTSVITALRELGYRAYHADDYCIYSRSLMWDRFDNALWSRGVSRCRMEAIALEPTTDAVRMAVRMSPKAKFILTWRKFSSWFKSTTGARVKEVRWGSIHEVLSKGNRFIPWIETWDDAFGTIRRVRQRGEPFFLTRDPIVAYIYRTACNGYAWHTNDHKSRGTFKSGAHEESYLGHQNEIRMLVPKERLLEFDVTKHSWEDLDRFLGRDSGRAGTPFPKPRTKETRTNDIVLESNWRNTRWALVVFMILHTLNILLIALAVRLLVWLLWLLAWALQLVDWPLEGAEELFEDAMDESPLVVVLEGVDPQTAVPLGRALLDAGARALAVPLHLPDAAESLRALAEALPPGSLALGGCAPRTADDVTAVYEVRGHFVLGPFPDRSVLRRTRSLGLAGLPVVCTPSEAAAAWRTGAVGLVVPAELASPAVMLACRDCLPQGTRVLAWGRADPGAVEDYWAAGARGFIASLGRPGESATDHTAAAPVAALVRACRAPARLWAAAAAQA
uniref:Uncharacterized protein n=1 Tax=Alexandrium catenella TaxID=2925 RepID=A0A7S1S4D8_ALECA